MGTVRDGSSVFDVLIRYSWQCNGVRGNVGGSSRSGRIGTDGDGSSVFDVLIRYSWRCNGVRGNTADRPDRDGS